MSDYKVTVKVQNNNILSLLASRGYSSISDFANKHKISGFYLYALVNLKQSPLTTKGEFRPYILQLCSLLNCLPEELFSTAQMETALLDNKRTFQVEEAEAMFMLQSQSEQKSLEQLVIDDQMDTELSNCLETLTPREKKVIEMRFGLNGYEAHTLEDTGSFFHVTRERIRSIEAKALNKLRHSSRSGLLHTLYK